MITTLRRNGTRATASQRLATFVADLDLHTVPDDVADAAALHALDAIGCGIAGFALGDGDFAVAAMAESPSAGPSSVIGQEAGMAAGEAALVNGILSHVLDYDDTHPDSVVHVSAAVTPAALAVGQQFGVAGRTVLAALVAGNEISTRVGAVAAGQFHARGFHPTGIAGVFGATAAAARLRGLDMERTAHAFGIAGSMASGTLEFLSDGAQTKPLHPGWAAQAGLAAARFAAHGATGPATVFEGARGYYATYLHGQEVDMEPFLESLEEQWETPAIAYKPYPCCHYIHAPVDALAALMREEPILVSDVERIVAYTEATGVALVLEPAADKLVPRTPYDSKFSLPYCLAHQLVRGKLDVLSFTEASIGDPDVLAVTPLVTYEERRYSPTPDSFGGGVRVHLRGGRVRELELRHQRGSAENPLSRQDIVGKFRANAALGLGDADIALLEYTFLDLMALPNLEGLTALGRARRRSDT